MSKITEFSFGPSTGLIISDGKVSKSIFTGWILYCILLLASDLYDS